MAKFYDEDGNEVEAYTQEEYNATKKVAEEADVFKKQVDELNEKLSKVDDKTLNFKELREKKENLEKELEEVKNSVSKGQSEIMAEIQTIKFDKKIRSVVGDDEELVEKVKLNYSRLAAPKEGEEDTRLNDAMVLSTGGRVNFNGVPGGGGTPPGATKKVGLNQDQVELAKKLGLTEDEIK